MKVIIVTVVGDFLCVYILPEAGVENIALHIVSGKGVARKKGVAVAVVDKCCHRVP